MNVWGKKVNLRGTGVTFSKGAPGNVMKFSGADSAYASRVNDLAFNLGTANFSISFACSLSATAAEKIMLRLRNSADDKNITFGIAVTTSALYWQATDDGATTDQNDGPAVDDAQWHTITATRSGSTWYLYVDGELVDSTPVNNANAALTPNILHLGTGNAATTFNIVGGLADLAIIKRALSANEIRWLHQRLLRRIQNSIDPDDALHAADVDFVSVDPNGRWIAAGNQDSVTIFDEFFIPKYRYVSPNGTMKSTALWSGAGMDSLSYALGTSTRLKFAQTDVRIAELSGQAQNPIFQPVRYEARTVVTPTDSGTTIYGGVTITPADSATTFKYAGPMSGDLRVGRNAEVRGSLRYGSASAVGADIAEMFSIAGGNYTLVVKSLADPSIKEASVPPLVRVESAKIYDNDSTRTYPYKIIRYEQYQKGRVFLDAGVKGRTGLVLSSIVYAQGVEVGDSLWHKPDSTTVKVRVNVVMGDTVSLASAIPANTEFTIYPPNLVAKYIQSSIGAGAVVQMGAGKTMVLSSNIGKKAWIVSSSPANILNADMEGIPVALIGTVPCRVSFHAIRGAVSVGDPLTGGPTGDLVKALAGEPISAWAQEAVVSGTKKISVLVE